MIDFESLVGKNTTPASKIMSAIVSAIVLSLIYFNLLSEKWFLFIIFHLVNHAYVAITELKIYVCHKCNKNFETKKMLKEHKCKN